MENSEKEKKVFEPCKVEVIHFGEDIILTSEVSSNNVIEE